MGILDRFQIKTAGWRAEGDPPWDLDLDRPAVAGIALREPATLLWKLGPPEDAQAAAQDRHLYCSRGVVAEIAHQRVMLWRLFWRDPAGRFAAFTGPCRFQSQPVDLHGGMEACALEKIFGPPVWQHREENAVRLFYAHHAAEWEFLLDAATGLQQLTLSALPLYARPAPGNAHPTTPVT